MKLIIADLNSSTISVWRNILQDLSEISLINTDFKTMVRLPEIDAVLLRAIFAHERYGGIYQIGKSVILSTNKEVGMPSWVVTTPTFTRDEKPRPEEYTYTEFSSVFESIREFNSSGKESKIQTLAFEISFLYCFRNALPYKDEAEELRRAYLDYSLRT